ATGPPKAGPSSRVPEPPHSPIESVSASPPQPTPIDLYNLKHKGSFVRRVRTDRQVPD
ncbi:hypothetical protein TNCT_293161, partial [Trichonephila clavata]